MKRLTYFEVIISDLSSQLEDEIAVICIGFGAEGVSRKIPWIQRDSVYTPEIVEEEVITLSAYFSERPSSEILPAVKELAPNVKIEVQEKPVEDWMEEWKKHFKPFRIVGPFWVVPSWLEAPSEAEVILKIDPGMAFGTGTHETTQIAAEIIYNLRENVIGRTALDIGTGTGILALILSHLGAASVKATEIDEIARETAIENIEINRPNVVEVLSSQVENVQEQFDFVIANIIDGVLIQLKAELLRVTKPGGYLILTGVLDERREEFLLKFLTGAELETIQSIQKGEWWGFVLRQKGH